MFEIQGNFIPIVSDYGFKLCFANEKNTFFLRKSLQAVIQSSFLIEEVSLPRNEKTPATIEDRGSFYDVIAKDEKGRIFVVEMQLGYYKQFVQRAKFYAFQQMNHFVDKGEYYFDNLPPIYTVSFIGKNIFEHEGYYHFGQLKNQENELLDEQML